MRILVAGTGNIFLGDDAFGVDVAQALMQHELPDDVHVADFGIRSCDLGYALLEGYDVAILVDAAQRGKPPGTLYVLEPALEDLDIQEEAVNAHVLDPVRLLRMVQALGGQTGTLYLVGCEPDVLMPANGQPGLSETVRKAVPEAVSLILSLIEDLLRNPSGQTPRFAGARHA